MLETLMILLMLGNAPITAHVDVPELQPILEETAGEGYILSAIGCNIGCMPGRPDIPSYPEWIKLPPGSRALSVDVVDSAWEEVEGSWDLRPLPYPAVPSLNRPLIPVEPIASIYENDAFWPRTPAKLTGTGFVDGAPCAELVITPFRYNPVSGRIEKLDRIDLRINTAPSAEEPVSGPGGDYPRMLIITDTSVRDAFDSLAAWRTEGGVYTDVSTIDDAYAIPGRDDPEKLRNYIITYKETYGLDYLLLGGDTELIPCRFAFAVSYETGGGRDDSLPCDLYYSDLDGCWNYDDDDIWGEVADSVDLYPDIYVGRATVEDSDEAWTFVNNVIDYESVTQSDHLEKCLFMGQVMWADPYTPGGKLKDYIIDHHLPDYFEPDRQYESEGTYGTSNAMDALNEGTAYVNISAHGWISVVGCLSRGDADNISSDGRFFGALYANGCWTAAFDYDAVAEHFLTNPDGGGVAYMGNSSYGWGSPGNPLFGYSDAIDREIYRIIFENPGMPLGEVLATGKLSYIPYAHEENVYRCVLYMLNLLGDPALVTYRMNPRVPSVELPGIVTENTTRIPITVDVPEVSQDSATVCIHDPDFTNYLVENIDASGSATLELSAPPSGDLTVTVTGTNIKRTTTDIPYGAGRSLVVADLQIDDQAGYGHLSPGSDADLYVTLANQGTEALTDVELTATLTEGPAQLLQNQASYGDLQPGDTSQGDRPLEVSVEASALSSEQVRLDLTLSSQEEQWTYELPMLVYAPGVYFSSYSVDDSLGGNGNGYPEAGESFDLLVNMANLGLLEAGNVTVVMPPGPSYLTWSTDSCTVDSIGPDLTAEFVFGASLSQSAPDLAFPELMMDISADPEWSSQDTLVLTVGETGLSEDVESGASGWTHTGTNDLWHISETSSHSPIHSWYCGDENTSSYEDNMNCGLISPELRLSPNSSFSFWSSFDVDLYGWDGVYVIVNQLEMGIQDTLDFIGSGGALGQGGSYGRSNLQWVERSYDLSYLDNGIHHGPLVQLELWFQSDSDDNNKQGFWVDDLTVEGAYQGGATGVEESWVEKTPGFGMPFPNPCSSRLYVPVNLEEGPVTVELYDLAGRMTSSRRFEGSLPERLEMETTNLSPGVYLVRIRTRGISETRKVVVAR
ncbi:T9SS type A sorting domain-containing protein [Candidatus Fermentibacteria bacterium]|nr:T9SS type A sorting domain-containing protein [Candidatus Fermentibacteria bacterium]